MGFGSKIGGIAKKLTLGVVKKEIKFARGAASTMLGIKRKKRAGSKSRTSVDVTLRRRKAGMRKQIGRMARKKANMMMAKEYMGKKMKVRSKSKRGPKKPRRGKPYRPGRRPKQKSPGGRPSRPKPRAIQTNPDARNRKKLTAAQKKALR